MKKTITLLSLLMLMLFACTFTSCEEDDTDRSMYISGQWRGDWGMYYTIDYRGRQYTFDSYDTDIVFYPEYTYATYGYGYQVDWYDDGPYERLSYRFDWEVRDGVIYLTYPGHREYNADIYRYSLDNDYFTGYFNNGTTRFRLAKIRDYYNWDYYRPYGNYYEWGNSSWSWGTYYPSPSRSVADSDSLSSEAIDASEARIVKIGNRFQK